MVAIHDSELTRALDGLPAVNASTPTGVGTSGFEWWPTNWHYFVMPESVKEALRSDGTAYEVVGDADIIAGRLVDSNGLPRYPIVISLASEAIADAEISQFTNYVAAGGTLMMGSSAFTRRPDGTGRGDFAFANELGLHMSNTNLTNWLRNTTFAKTSNHSLVSHFPSGVLNWHMPLSSEDTPWGISPAHILQITNLIWQVQPGDATVIAQGDSAPYLAVKQYGRGKFIYHAGMQPLIANGGYGPGMYAYGIFRNAIQGAFANLKVATPRLSAWPYPYDAALNVRHDFEDFQDMISAIESSARFEFTNGAYGDYFFCTGTLRDEMTNSPSVVAGLREAVTTYGATIGPHNGGFANPNNTNLIESAYDFWHWGPDEALNVSPPAYASGADFAFASISNSFNDVEGWLSGFTNATRSWVAPYFNATREASFDIEERLGIKITGEQKLTPFPHWTLSTQTPGKRYSFLTLPVSDWYVNSEIGQSAEAGHNSGTIHALVDYYYNLGALINLYSHSSSDGTGLVGGLVQDYVRYALGKPRVWSTNAQGVYEWWVSRGAAQIIPSFTTSSNESVASVSINGSTDPRLAVEVLIPQSTFSSVQVVTNGVAASGGAYRMIGSTVRILAGMTVTNAEVHYLLTPTAQPDSYMADTTGTLNVAAPGVLANDTPGLGTNLTAILVSGPNHGAVTLNADGSFVYTPAANYLGVDNFTYKANDGISDGNTVLVTISVANASAGVLFTDDFARFSDPGPLNPWQVQNGNWTASSGMLSGGTNASQTYGFVYLTNNWANYAIEARLRFPVGAFGGGIGSCLNPLTGAHYAAWVYPEGSAGGARMLRLIKFQNWTSFGYNGTPFAAIEEIGLPTVGTNWHQVKLWCQNNQILVFYDGALMINATDREAQVYAAGGVSLDMWTDLAQYTVNVDDVRVTGPSVDQTITFNAIGSKTYGDAAFSPDVTASSGLPITLTVLSGPATIASGNLVTLTGTGTVTLRGSQAGNDSIKPAVSVDQSFTINPAVLTVMADDKAKIYGGAVPGLTASFTGFVNGETPSVLSGAPDLSTAAQSSSPAGIYPITASQGTLQASNYVFSFVAGQLTITKAPLNVSAYDAWRIAGQANPELLVSYTGFVNGDDQTVLSGAPALDCGATPSSPVGYYPIHTTVGTLTSPNYDFTFSNGVLRVLPAQSVFYDDFTRATNPGALSPWIAQSGTWTVSSGTAKGGPNAANNYAFLYETNSWDDYSIEARIRFPVGAFGGGIGARLNTSNGAHYAAWVYPENSPGGSNILALIKFQDWNNFGHNGIAFQPIAQVNLDSVGTNWHSVKLSLLGTNLQVYFDTNLLISATDTESHPYTNGVATVDMWTAGTSYLMEVDDLDMEEIVQNQTITFSNPGTHTYGDGPFAPGATASSGLPIGYTLISGPAAISNGVVTLLGTGNVTVRASQIGDAHYYAAADVDVTFAVNPAPLTISADNLARVYGAPNPVLTGSLVGVVNGENITATYSTAADPTSAAGSYTINAAVVDPENRLTNYVVVTNNGTLTVTAAPLTVKADNQSRTYGSPNPELTGVIVGLQNGDNITASYSTAAQLADPVGNYGIIPTLHDESGKLANYVVTLQNGTLAITPAPLIGTAQNATRQYGQTNPVFGVTYTGFANGENSSVVTGTLIGASANTNAPVGIYPITVSGQSAANYTITYVPGSLTITPAPLTIRADDKSRGYGQTNPVFTATYFGFENGETNDVLGGNLAFSTIAETNSPVGTYSIEASGLLSSNYFITFSNGTLTVTPFALTVTADNQIRTYGATNPALTGTISGIQNGDDVTVSYSTPASPSSAVGPYAIIPSLTDPGNKLTNYAVTINQGTLTVTPAALSVTATDVSRLYGETNPTLSGTITGIQNGDNITASYSTAASASSPVGSYAIVPGLTDTDNKLSNYALTVNNGTLTVNAAILTGTANNVSRLYGQTNPVFTASYSGFVNGETESILAGVLSGSTTAATNSAVGSYPITVSGQTAPNYTIHYLAGTLTVLPTSLIVRADDKTRAYGQTNPPLTATFSGFANGEDSSVLAGNLLLSTTADTNSPIGSYSIDASGLLSSNYSIIFSNGTLSVTPFALTASANNQSRTYGAANPDFTGVITGIQNGDDISASYSTTADPSSPVGDYSIVPSLIDPQGKLTNYSVTLNNGALRITRAALSVTADDKARTYGGTNPVFTGIVIGLQNSDQITATYSTVATPTSAVGTYNIVPALNDSDGKLTNYTVSITNGLLTINAATLIGTANDASRLYGQTNPLFAVTYSGFVNGESQAILTGTLTGVTIADTNSPIGNYPITVSGQASSNYVINYQPGTLSVQPAPLRIAANDTSRLVNHSNPPLTASYIGLVNGESPAVLGGAPALTTAATPASPVGEYDIVVGMGTVVPGNYTVSVADGYLRVLPLQSMFYDNFTRTNQPATLSPWVIQSGTWTINGNRLSGGPSPVNTYSFAYITNSGSDYSVEASVQFPVGAFGGGIGGRLDLNTGGHYAAWLYPENSPGGSNILRLIKFQDWNTFAYQGVNFRPIQEVNLGSVGTNWHALKLAFHGTNIQVYLDSNLLISAADAETNRYTSGVVSVDMWTVGTPYVMNVDDVEMDAIAAPQTIVFADPGTKTYGDAPFVLTAAASSGLPVDLALVSGPASLVGNTLTVLGAGTVTVHAEQQGSVDFYGTNADLTFTVNPAVITASANDQSRVYGATNPILTGTVVGVKNGENITATYSTDATPLSPAGAYPIQVALLDPENRLTNYIVVTNTGTLTVARAPLTITADNKSRPYGAVNPPLTGTILGLQNGDAIGATFATTASDTSPVSSYDIVPSVVDSAGKIGNYDVTLNNGTLSITPAILLATANDATRTYGQTNPTFGVTYSGFLNGDTTSVVTGALVCSCPARTNSPAGTYPIVVSGQSAANYTVTYHPGTLTIMPAPLLVQAADKSRYYGQSNPVFSMICSGFVNSEDSSVLSGAPIFSTSAQPSSPVGAYPIQISGLSSSNYAITFSNGTLTVTASALNVTANSQSRAYGAANPELTGSISGLQNADNITAVFFTAATPASPVGTYSILPALNDPDNKLTNYIVSVHNGVLTVNPAALTATANNVSRLYGQTNPVFTASYGGFVNGDTVGILSGSLIGSTMADTNSPVGAYAINVSGQSAPNYTITYLPGVLSVTPAPLLVKADDNSRAYGQTNPVFTASMDGFMNGEQREVLGGTLTFSTTAQTNSPVGNYPINVSGLLSTNYSISFSNGNLAITPFALTVTPNNQSRTYGDTNPPLTGSIEGIQNGDQITASYSTTATTTSPVGNYGIVPSLNDPQNKLTNYSVTLNNGTLTISKAVLSVVADHQTRVFSAPNPALSYQFNGFVNGDTPSVISGTPDVSTAADITSPVGSYPISLSVGTLGAANYSFTFQSSTLDVTAALVSVGLTSSANPSTQFSNVTFTVSVGPVSPATATPSGSVQFRTNGAAVGGPISLVSGSASFSTANLLPGANLVTAEYAGDGNFSPGTNTLVQVINILAAPPGVISIRANSDGSMTVTFTGTPGAQYAVQASSDLTSPAWIVIGTPTAGADGAILFTDSTASHFPTRFYRAAVP